MLEEEVQKLVGRVHGTHAGEQSHRCHAHHPEPRHCALQSVEICQPRQGAIIGLHGPGKPLAEAGAHPTRW
jgi:hypothetical protein